METMQLRKIGVTKETHNQKNILSPHFQSLNPTKPQPKKIQTLTKGKPKQGNGRNVKSIQHKSRNKFRKSEDKSLVGDTINTGGQSSGNTFSSGVPLYAPTTSKRGGADNYPTTGTGLAGAMGESNSSGTRYYHNEDPTNYPARGQSHTTIRATGSVYGNGYHLPEAENRPHSQRYQQFQARRRARQRALSLGVSSSLHRVNRGTNLPWMFRENQLLPPTRRPRPSTTTNPPSLIRPSIATGGLVMESASLSLDHHQRPSPATLNLNFPLAPTSPSLSLRLLNLAPIIDLEALPQTQIRSNPVELPLFPTHSTSTRNKNQTARNQPTSQPQS